MLCVQLVLFALLVPPDSPVLRDLRDLTDLRDPSTIGRTASVTIVRPKSMEKAIDFCFRTEGAAGSVAPTIDSNGCTYDLAERYRLMQSICRTLRKGITKKAATEIVTAL